MALKGNLMNPLAFVHANYQIPLFFFCTWKWRECPWGTHLKTRYHHQSIGYYSQQLDSVAWEPPGILPQHHFRAITVVAFSVKAIWKITVGCPLTIFIPHVEAALLNSHHTTLLSQMPHLLWSPFVNCSSRNSLRCDKLYPVTLLPSIIYEVPHNCLSLMDHLLTTCHDLKEIPPGNADFSWLTDGSHLHSDNGKHCAGCAFSAVGQHLYLWLIWSNRVNYMLLYRLVLQPRTKLPILTLTVDRILEQLMILECCGSNVASLPPAEIKLKVASMFRN